MLGRIHSVESFGTVDGPGVRFVIFFQGCPMRCKYCHNPDSWEVQAGTSMSAEELLDAFEHNKSFYKGGGITATGGEPLLQLPFLTELFLKAKERGIHTCLDTSGCMYQEGKKAEYEKLFSCTDLVLLDIKHSDKNGHKDLTGHSQEETLAFLDALEEAKVPVIIRHVVVPGITDQEEELEGVGRLIASHRNVKGLEVLPYHTMGVSKYRSLGMSYPLEGTKDLGREEARRARQIILDTIRKERGMPR